MGKQLRHWALAELAIIILLALSGCARADNSVNTGGNIPLSQRKLVWAHNIPVFNLDIRDPNAQRYGALYPLALRARAHSDSYDEIIQAAQKAGIDGFSIDIFTNVGQIRPFYASADRNKFLIAPCLDLSILRQQHKDLKAGLLQAVETYCREAGSHPSCARERGAFIVFMYGTASLPADTWQDVRATLKNEGLNVFWVGDINVNFNRLRPGVYPDQDNIRQQTLAYLSCYDMGYSFVAIPDQYWDTIRGVFAENHKPFAGGMWPGYYRGIVGNRRIQPFGSDADGTALYRGYWQRQIQAGLPWTHITTWNDFTEHSNLNADTSYNVTRSEVTAWYAAKFRNQPPPFHDARLYVTTPQALFLNQSENAEALVLNPTSRPVHVTLRLFDGAGAPYGTPVSKIAEPNSEVAVTIPVKMSEIPAGHFLRARARVGTSNAIPSAPILIYNMPLPPASIVPELYYSVPANHALPGRVGFSISNGQANLSVPSGVTPRFVDLLHDQNIVKTVNTAHVGTPIPLDEDADLKMTDDNYYDAQDFGLYVERVIDDQDRVGFSDPVYVTVYQRTVFPSARRYAH